MSIVVMGAVFVDIKGYPLSSYIPGGRNAGRMEQVHGGVSRNIVEDIANVELRPTFVSLVDNTSAGADVVKKLQSHKVDTRYIRTTPDGIGTWLAIFDNTGDVTASISKRPDLSPIADILDDLTRDGYLVELVPGKYQASEITTSAEGTFVRRSNGKNSVIVDGAEVPVFVAERNSKHALNGDRVRVHLCAQRKGFEPEAQVLEIIEKKEQVFIGTLKVSKNYAFLVTESKFLACDIFIPKAKIKGGESGDKAIVRIVDWNDDDKNPTGEVVDILGRTGENNSEMNAILAEYGLPYVYPKNVEAAADKIDAGITPEVIAAREDMRGVTTFTIDPRDAKDFDDALSLRKLPNGNWEAGVHIADVTHYVRPGSVIDKEAEKRATSVYLVDRTIPMLPEHLCNGICSLRPNEEKLAYSCIFEMDDNANIINHRIRKTVIKLSLIHI